MNPIDTRDIGQFVQDVPFSCCDYRCLLCPYRRTCPVSKEIQNIPEKISTIHPDHWKTFSVVSRLEKLYGIGANHLNKAIEEIEKRALGFQKPDPVQELKFTKLFQEIDNVPLTITSKAFVAGTLSYLKRFDRSTLSSQTLKDDFFNLAYYAPFTDAKIIHLLASVLGSTVYNNKALRLPGYLSGRMAYTGLTRCTLSLKNILSRKTMILKPIPQGLLELSEKLTQDIYRYLVRVFPEQVREDRFWEKEIK